jgi:hypothetical protein
MPEVHHAARAAGESASEHGIGAPVKDRLHKAGQLVRIIFKIRILYDDQVPRRPLNARAYGSALPAVHRMRNQRVDRAFLVQRLQNGLCAIRGGIIHHN